MPQGSLVCIVDDDDSVRGSLRGLFAATGITAVDYSSAELLLAADILPSLACLVLDVSMPGGMTGPELQRELLARQKAIPIVFISGSTDREVRERALRDGAIAYLHKPFDEDELLALVRGVLPAPASP